MFTKDIISGVILSLGLFLSFLKPEFPFRQRLIFTFEYYMKNNERLENYRRGQIIQKLQTAFELSNCS